LVADDTPSLPAGLNAYRLNVTDLKTGEVLVRQVTAKDPDDAVGRTIDMVGHGLLEGEAFWDSYKITAIVQECAGGTP
jgi:hypothetical protein